ncbi:flagellar biosynthesis protein FlhA [Alienimonas californiensis]|uniref:Flagellar biosynthesis protein FlhA n=1 Tax=Alienimonas californiensis TaxID=2527989 RepID=A0A517PCI2_9PLAN|nr:flagellar biosynthesis protein FlhA [Alienimonas californiensis]QDT17098.1 Flagellar biosynthesis protein FlhA [Alienimonas californiensis]
MPAASLPAAGSSPFAAGGALGGAVASGRALLFPVLLCGAVLVIIVPLPAAILDLMLAANVTLATVILLVTVYVRRPLEFSVFPAVLLGTTLSRLVLNVASTRLILSRAAEDGTGAAGGVIEAFGAFVSGDNLAIGLILFVILVAIQFLVITKGATRVGEVAARFALDGMPGKQMAIDADLSAGLIDQAEAKRRRDDVTSQADFYGAMDGAGKFVRGDAIAGIVITCINIAGGLYVGVIEEGMAVGTAATVFTTLTIGDGLVSQVPAFLISLAAGLIVTRSSNSTHLPTEIITQLFRYRESMILAGGFLVALAFTGLPKAPLLSLAAVCGIVGWTLGGKKDVDAKADADADAVDSPSKKEGKADGKAPERKPEDELEVEPLALELGVNLLKLVDPTAGGDLLDRVAKVRRNIAGELGVILPKVRFRDVPTMDPNSYRVKIRGVVIATGECHANAKLAVDTGSASGSPPGMPTVDPAFGRPAVWVDPTAAERAALMGYHVVEPAAVVVTHLTEIVRDHAAELLTRTQVHGLLDHLKERCPELVGEVVPDLLRAGQVQAVLANLLRERVPVRDLEAILEALADHAGRTKDPHFLTECARHALARTLCELHRDDSGVLHVVSLDPAAEELIASKSEFREGGFVLTLPPLVRDAVVRGLKNELNKLTAAGHAPVVLVGPQVRLGLREIVRDKLPKLTVMSLTEVTRDTNLEVHGQLAAESLRSGPKGPPAPGTQAPGSPPPPKSPLAAFA